MNQPSWYHIHSHYPERKREHVQRDPKIKSHVFSRGWIVQKRMLSPIGIYHGFSCRSAIKYTAKAPKTGHTRTAVDSAWPDCFCNRNHTANWYE
jgi:hypothetical protein